MVSSNAIADVCHQLHKSKYHNAVLGDKLSAPR